MLKVSVVLVAIIAVALGARASGPHHEKPDKFKDVQGCYIPDLDQVIPFGGSAPAKSRCMEYRCGTTNIVYVTCGVARAEPPLMLVTDPTQPYPGCCPKVVAPA